MWTMARTAVFAIVMGFLAPEFGFAQCESNDRQDCTQVQLQDPLGLHKCLDDAWDICSGKEVAKQEEQINKLAHCLTKSGSFEKLMFIFADGLRETMFFLLELVLPGAARALTGSNRPPYRPWPHGMPQGCQKKINISVPQNPGIKRCKLLMESFCKGSRLQNRHMLEATLLSSLVCILQNIPPGAALKLLKEFTCKLLQTVTIIIQETRVAPLLLPVVQLLRVVLDCGVYNPKAE